MPAIKGDMYINTHCNYSQPTLVKLYNENIGGHLTPLQPTQSSVYLSLVIPGRRTGRRRRRALKYNNNNDYDDTMIFYYNNRS